MNCIYINILSYNIINEKQVYTVMYIQYMPIFAMVGLGYPLHTGLQRLTLQTWRTRPGHNTGNTSSLPGTQTAGAGTPKNSTTIVCVKVKKLVYYNKSYYKMVILPYILCTLYIYINTHTE